MGSAPVFAKKRNQDNPGREAADMGGVGHPSCAWIYCTHGLVEKLQPYPKNQQNPRGEIDDAKEWTNQEDQRLYPRMGKKNEVGAEHS